jgi:phosphonate transport system substrate-binding protein
MTKHDGLFRKPAKCLCILCFCLLALAGCSDRKDRSPSISTLMQEDTGRHLPAKPSRPSLRIGLIPEESIFKQIRRYQPIASYLGARIGRKVELKVLTRYGNVIENFRSSELDGAFFGSFTYALSHAMLGVQVLVRPEGLDGRSTFRGCIFVRKDSGIKTVTEMKGKRFVFVDEVTTAGYLVPLVFFKMHGINDYRSYFRETYFAGTHEDAIYDVLQKKADIGAAKSTVLDRLAQQDPRIRQGLAILYQSSEFPENGFALRKDLDANLIYRIKEVLLNMHNDAAGQKVLLAFGARRFIETSDRDYQAVLDLAKKIHVNLATYEDLNE